MTEELAFVIEVTLREIVESDLAAFREWYGRVRDDNFARSFERHQLGEVVYLVAEVNGRPVGHLGVDLVRVRDAVVLWQFGIMPVLQGLGIGSAMVRRAEQVVRDRGFAIAEIGAETDNPRARALYERLGYTLIDEREGEWILRKDLLAKADAVPPVS